MKKIVIMLVLCTATSGIAAEGPEATKALLEYSSDPLVQGADNNDLLNNQLTKKNREELLAIFSCIDLIEELPTQLPDRFGCREIIKDYAHLYTTRDNYSEEEFERKKQKLKCDAFGVMHGYSWQQHMNRRKAKKQEKFLRKRLQSTNDPQRAKKIERQIDNAQHYQDMTQTREKNLLTIALGAKLATPRNVIIAMRKPPKSRLKSQHRRSERKLDQKIFDQ